MPQATEKSTPITIYPSGALAARIRELAAAERRSINAQVLILLEKSPELRQEVTK